jgi:uncharacterized delta-60 repeat protein
MFNVPFTFFGNDKLMFNSLIYAGAFTTFSGTTVNRIYASELTSIKTPLDGFVTGTGFNSYTWNAIADSQGRLIVIGSFTTYKGTTANRIIRLLPNGDRDTTFNIGTGFIGGDTRCIAIDSIGRIYVGGIFTTYQGASTPRLVRLLPNGTRDTSFTPPSFNSRVCKIVLVDDKPILVGYFTSPTNSIIKLNLDGSIDTSFNVGTGLTGGGSFPVETITKDASNNVYVGGRFTAYKGVSAIRMVKILPNGDMDTTFNVGTGFNESVESIDVLTNGRIIVGGAFTTYKGVAGARLLRLFPNGDRDTSFVPRAFTSSTSDNDVRGVIEGENNSLYVCGTFETYDGQAYRHLIKVNSTGALDTTFLGTLPNFNAVVYNIYRYQKT